MCGKVRFLVSFISLLISLSDIVTSESAGGVPLIVPKVSELRVRSVPVISNNNEHLPYHNDVSGQPVTFTNQYANLMLGALTSIQSRECRNDLNATIKGIELQQPWAIASKLV